MKKYLLLPVLMFACICVSNVVAADVTDSERGKQTASRFIGNFGKFIEWPDNAFAGASAPYLVCTMGGNPFGAQLQDELADKVARDRSFNIKHLSADDVEGAKSCNMVYLHTDTVEQAKTIVDALDGAPVLTISELENFAQYGGMIGMLGSGRKVALQINKTRLESAQLKASSRLYKISTL